MSLILEHRVTSEQPDILTSKLLSHTQLRSERAWTLLSFFPVLVLSPRGCTVEQLTKLRPAPAVMKIVMHVSTGY